MSLSFDDAIRLAAFNWLKEKTALSGNVLPWTMLSTGFIYEGKIIHLVGQQGIWKPADMKLPISITTKFEGPYPDMITQNGLIEYRYRGNNINHRDNAGLREIMHLKKPLIYLFRNYNI